MKVDVHHRLVRALTIILQHVVGRGAGGGTDGSTNSRQGGAQCGGACLRKLVKKSGGLFWNHQGVSRCQRGDVEKRQNAVGFENAVAWDGARENCVKNRSHGCLVLGGGTLFSVALSLNAFVAWVETLVCDPHAGNQADRSEERPTPPRTPRPTVSLSASFDSPSRIVPLASRGYACWGLFCVFCAGCSFGQELFPERVRVEWTSDAEPVAAAYFSETSVVGGRGVQLRFNVITGCVSLVSPQTVSLSPYQRFETSTNAVSFTAPEVERGQLRNRSDRMEFGREAPGLLSPETLPSRLVLFPLLWQDLNGNGLLDFQLDGPSERACVAEGLLADRAFWLFEVLINTRNGQAQIVALGKQPAPDSNLPERVPLTDETDARWTRNL